MTICLNGVRRFVPDGATLEKMVEHFLLKKKSVVVELNRKVIDRNALHATRLHENDTVEVVHFVGGG